MLKLYVQTIALLMAFACVGACEAKPPFGRLHEATFRMENGEGLCSATAVGPHVVLTATHCIHVGTERIALNGVATDVLGLVDDGRDHVLVRTQLTFKAWLRPGGPLQQGDAVLFFGNPDGIFDVLRQGMFAGIARFQTPDWPQPMPVGALMFVCEGTHGDSGAAILDARGGIVAVVTGGYQSSDGFRLMFSLPIQFTAEQWRGARK